MFEHSSLQQWWQVQGMLHMLKGLKENDLRWIQSFNPYGPHMDILAGSQVIPVWPIIYHMYLCVCKYVSPDIEQGEPKTGCDSSSSVSL